MSLILGNADQKVGLRTPRVTHAIISSEIELLLTPDANSLHAVSGAELSSKIEARVDIEKSEEYMKAISGGTKSDGNRPQISSSSNAGT